MAIIECILGINVCDGISADREPFGFESHKKTDFSRISTHSLRKHHKPLGCGQAGIVWRTNRKTAVKAIERERNYRNERDSYLRLKQLEIAQIGIFDRPTLIDFEDSMLIVKMAIVSPPYLLDFGKAYVDCEMPYTLEQLEEHLFETAELFEPQDWPNVGDAVLELKLIGIGYIDIKPANICVRRVDTPD